MQYEKVVATPEDDQIGPPLEKKMVQYKGNNKAWTWRLRKALKVIG